MRFSGTELPYISVAVEGISDEAVVRRLIGTRGADIHRVQVQQGKSNLRRALPGYNSAAQGDPWLVLVDLDQDFACAPLRVADWLPQAGQFMRFRVVVRQIEAWLLADTDRFSDFFGVARAALPALPDDLPDAKVTVLTLVAGSSRRAIREDMVPRPGSGRRVGPAYTSRLIELRESVREVVIPSYVQAEPAPRQVPRPLLGMPDQQLLGYGVPEEWLNDVRQADEDGLLALAAHLPAEAMEAVLQLATGGTPEMARVAAPADAFSHPDAQRRFRVVTSVDELAQALDAPWDKWAVFLHPEQRQLVERDYTGPARVAGSAGTGKTIVAIHRAAYLARTNPQWRVLLTTFSEPLARSLRISLKRLLGGEPRVAERLEVHALPSLGHRLYQAQIGPPRIATAADVAAALNEAMAAEPGVKLSRSFVRAEWNHVVDAWQLTSWEGYRDVSRLGRRTRLPESRRAELWAVFERTRAALASKGLITLAAMFEALATSPVTLASPAYDAAVVDEAQDISITELRFLAALAAGRPNGLFFAGDLGQRIFQQPFSWKALGVDVRGRSKTLRVNYRTSHQIREQADRLLGLEVADVDGEIDGRRHAVSVFNGPPPLIRTFNTADEESVAVGSWLRAAVDAGTTPREIGIFVRSHDQIERARSAVAAAGLHAEVLDDRIDIKRDGISVALMHLAKGLEFRQIGQMGQVAVSASMPPAS